MNREVEAAAVAALREYHVKVCDRNGAFHFHGEAPQMVRLVLSALAGEAWRPTADQVRRAIEVHVRQNMAAEYPGGPKTQIALGLAGVDAAVAEILALQPLERVKTNRPGHVDPISARRNPTEW